MANAIIERKRQRLSKIRAFVEAVKEKGEEIVKSKVIAWLIVQEGISKKLATEEVEAIIEYNG